MLYQVFSNFREKTAKYVVYVLVRSCLSVGLYKGER